MTYRTIPFRTILIMLLFIGSAVAQDQAGVTKGGYSPAFQQLMQQQETSGNMTCQPPKTSMTACSAMGIDVKDVTDIRESVFGGEPKECGEEGGRKGEIIGTDPFTGKTCRIEFFCKCGKDT